MRSISASASPVFAAISGSFCSPALGANSSSRKP